MRDARAAANGERTVTSVPMSLTHSRAWRPGASPSDAVVRDSACSLSQGESNFLFDLSSPHRTRNPYNCLYVH